MHVTTAQLEDRITEGILSQYVPETGEDRTRVLEGYAIRASARVDAILSPRYASPIPDSPLLSDIAQSFALWQIAADRGSLSGEIPATFQKPYDEAVAILRRIAEGAIPLEGAAGAVSGSAALSVSSPEARIAPDSPGMEFF